jgi:hypothetical protein
MAQNAQLSEIDKLKAELAQKENEIENLRQQFVNYSENQTSLKPINAVQTGLEAGVASPVKKIEELYDILREAMDYIVAEHFDGLHLTSVMRKRLHGAGERRWGSIEMTHQMSENDKQYYTFPLSSWEGLDLLMQNVLRWREIDELGERISRVARDHYLTTSNAAYAMARIYYNNVQAAARAGDVNAQVIYNDLKTYYARMGNRHNIPEEPTIEQTIKEAKSLARGHKDGEIVIKHKSPQMTKGEHLVEVDTHAPGGAFKATVQGRICNHCHCEVPEHYKFCNHCGAAMINN